MNNTLTWSATAALLALSAGLVVAAPTAKPEASPQVISPMEAKKVYFEHLAELRKSNPSIEGHRMEWRVNADGKGEWTCTDASHADGHEGSSIVRPVQ